MEGHLFHVYSHVYTLNNLYAENMTVRCMHTPFRHIQQKPESNSVTFLLDLSATYLYT